MGQSQGNWHSDDGVLLHVCPYADAAGGTADIHGQYISGEGTYTLENATCENAGEGRFKIKAQWTVPAGGKTFHLEGNAKIIDTDAGPTFMYGKITSDGGAAGDSWEATRYGRPAGSGPGEDGKGSPHDGGGTGTG